MNSACSLQELTNIILREITDITQQTVFCIEKNFQKVQSLLISRRLAYGDSPVKQVKLNCSRNASCKFLTDVGFFCDNISAAAAAAVLKYVTKLPPVYAHTHFCT
jgi:hypothetical protein